ncbi:MAG: hypothetical protein GC204_09485 [Chloroflexi bacterium]|nr:hypothetical protein [Chloroflexota bacterium]
MLAFLVIAQSEVVPDTTGYLFLALAVFFGLLLLFIGSLWLRARNLRKDEALIEQLREDK